MAKGIRRKELREPDEFLSLSSRFIEYAKQHEQQVTVAALALVVLVALTLGIRWYRSAQAEHAAVAFGAAHRDFRAQKFDAAATGFARVSSAWPRTAYGELARLYLGNSYAELGKTAEAEAAFADAAKSRDQLLRQIAEYNLGLAKLKRGDKPGAAADLGAAAAVEGPLRGPAWFARLGAGQAFVESMDEGVQAIEELPPEQKAYVEKHVAGGAAKEAKAAE
ncbi:MAG: tetratricopeptide repeat protein [Candidatus Binatia bacterium]